MDRELHPHRVIVGSETHPPTIAANWQLVREHPHVIGDFTWTGWDYLGEVGIGRVAVRRRGRAARAGSWASTRGSPPGAATSTSPGTAVRCRTGARSCAGLRAEPYVAVRPPAHHGEPSTRPAPAGPSPTRSRRGRGPASRAQPVDGRGVRRCRRGRAPRGRHAGRSRARRRGAPLPGASSRPPTRPASSPRSRTATEPRPVARRWSRRRDRCALDVRVDHPLIDADRPRPRVRRDQRSSTPTANLHVRRGPRGDGRGRRSRPCSRASGSGNPCTEETFGVADARHVRRARAGRGATDRTRARSPSPSSARRLRRPHGRDRVRRAAEPRPVTWELRWHPFRGEWVLFTSHRGARPWIGETIAADEPAVPDDNALGTARHGASTRRTPTTAACSCSPTTCPCSRPTRRSRSTATTSTAPGAPSAPPRSSATTTTRPSRWPTSTTTR